MCPEETKSVHDYLSRVASVGTWSDQNFMNRSKDVLIVMLHQIVVLAVVSWFIFARIINCINKELTITQQPNYGIQFASGKLQFGADFSWAVAGRLIQAALAALCLYRVFH